MVDPIEALRVLRLSSAGWILRWLIAKDPESPTLTIGEGAYYTKIYSETLNRTAVIRAQPDVYLLHFIEGTQEIHSSYFTVELTFDVIATLPAEAILKFLSSPIPKSAFVEWIKSMQYVE